MNYPITELTDTELDNVSGGLQRPYVRSFRTRYTPMPRTRFQLGNYFVNTNGSRSSRDWIWSPAIFAR